MTQLKKIDFTKKEFIGKSGKKYIIEQSINYQRWIQWRKLQVKLAYGGSVEEIMQQARKAYDLLNGKESKVLEAGIVLYNLMNGLVTIADDSRIPEVIQICSLFMNTQEEDRTQITEAMVKEKAEDWIEYDMQDFFLFAVSSIPNFNPTYESITQNTLPTKEAAEKVMSTK